MAKMDEKQEKMWAMLCHIGALAGFIIPFGNIIAPLIIWSMKKADSPLVDDQGKESLNFQISISIASIVAWILIVIVIGVPLLIALGIFDIVMIIIAGIKANDGEKYRYPVNIRLIK
ncbi:MAG: DUF4870 domain-containing protein [Candidatus Omnitrophica bacterium]|nr:DUF4870 domain-containing protein [Candidatus Omnitrophota bacterium]MBU1631436.1 DUF4870 domain-containing protein [Candidatus Omnitrophota bacterium]MBU1767395.1 DUF4870 domain-containing protein [Candidatus Omnitrophota bacterium]MBU1889831.1 DUF4870 domain-containing protein [Candidatus Omnitrophota bacterium]